MLDHHQTPTPVAANLSLSIILMTSHGLASGHYDCIMSAGVNQIHSCVGRID